ncbi:hypothetical protein ACSL9C_000872 [Vibrio navarrensis]
MWWHYLLDTILIPFSISLIAGYVVVFFGVRSLKDYILERERKREVGKLVNFWVSPSNSTVYNLVIGADWTGREGEIDPRFGYAQAYGVAELTDCLSNVFNGTATVNTVVVKKNDELSTQLFDENVVIFGGEASILAFGELSRKLQVPYYQYRLDMNKRSFQSEDSECPNEAITSKVVEGNLITDYGTVTRIVNPSNDRLIVLLNGNFGAGLLGSVLAISRNSELLDGVNSNSEAQQIIITVPNISENMINRKHKVNSSRKWIEFNIPCNFKLK